MTLAVSALFIGLCGCDGSGTTPEPIDNDRTTLDETVVDDDTLLPAGIDEPGGELSFDAGPAFCCNALSIDFTVTPEDTVFPPGSVIEWDFGDGRAGTGFAVSHTYAWSGSYLVTLRVRSGEGETVAVQRLLVLSLDGDSGTEIDLSPPDETPDAETDDDTVPPASVDLIADAGSDRVVNAGDVVTLIGSASTDSQQTELSYRWRQTTGTPVALATPEQPVATFTAPDITSESENLIFSLLVTQGDAFSSDMVTITVMAEPVEDPNDDTDDGDPDDNTDTGPDVDADGLPDRWEVYFFGGIEACDGNGDEDGDSIDNRTEFRDRTDPTRADVNQRILNRFDRALRSFWESGGRFDHTVDGELIGWPILKTVDTAGPTYWGVDNGLYANRPVISIQGPGVANVGMIFLRAYGQTGNKLHLSHALAAARTLLSVQRDLETHADGSARPPLESGGWIDFAVIIPDNADTQSQLQSEIGHWTTVRVPGGYGDIDFVSRDRAYMAFDDSISTNPAMFLLELHHAVEDLDFSQETIDPLSGVSKVELLSGAGKLFTLADLYRTTFQLTRADFDGLYITFDGDNRDKDGPHPFVAYLEGLPDHPLNNGQAFHPYANGGLPHGIEAIERGIIRGGAKYGSLASGHTLHKHVNDHVIARYILFLARYYELTGDPAVLANLELQLDWLVDVFQAYGDRGWCQQYHVLDDACAASRYFEPPAFAMIEGIPQIHRIGYVERFLEQQHGIVHNDVRAMLEDATYYFERVIVEDDPEKVFQYYAVQAYDESTDPSGYPAINADDPVFACDYYYPDDPYAPCASPYDGFSYNYYLIDEEANGEFVAPNGKDWLSNVSSAHVRRFMIDDACLDSPTIDDYRGCLDLNKDFAAGRGYWDLDKQYWGCWSTATVDGFLGEEGPDENGLWTSVADVQGQPRAVIQTYDFVVNAMAAVRCIGENSNGIVDADSDGLANGTELSLGTDPYHPDSDGDGLIDGDEVILYATDPSNPDTDGDGCSDGVEVESGTDPTTPTPCP